MIKKDTSNATKFHGCRAFRYEKLWFGRYKKEKKNYNPDLDMRCRERRCCYQYHTDLWGATIHSL